MYELILNFGPVGQEEMFKDFICSSGGKLISRAEPFFAILVEGIAENVLDIILNFCMWLRCSICVKYFSIWFKLFAKLTSKQH